MIAAKYMDVPQTLPMGPDNKHVRMRVLIGEEQRAPNFVMRHFEVLPGGSTPYHDHPWEHEVFVLSGRGRVNTEEGETPLETGSFVFVPAGEKHNFETLGNEPLEFLCIIPKEEKCDLS